MSIVFFKQIVFKQATFHNNAFKKLISKISRTVKVDIFLGDDIFAFKKTCMKIKTCESMMFIIKGHILPGTYVKFKTCLVQLALSNAKNYSRENIHFYRFHDICKL